MKNKKILIILIILTSVIIGCIFFKRNQNEIEIQKYANSTLDIILGEYNVPKYISGEFTDRKIVDKQSALESINDIKELLDLQSAKDEFYVKNVYSLDNVKYYELQQKSYGLDVLGGELTISVDNDGNVLALNGNYIPNISLKNNVLSSTSALDNLLKGTYGEEIDYDYTKKIVNIDNRFIAIYLITLETANDVLEVWVDAVENKIILEESLIKYANYTYTGTGLENKTYTINITEKNKDIFSKEKEYEFVDKDRKIYITDASGIGADFAGLVLTKIFSNSNPLVAKMNNQGKLEYGEAGYREWDLQAAITAMKSLEDIYDYYKNILGRDSYDNKGSKIIVNMFVDESTNFLGYSRNLYNASWIAKPFNQMMIGGTSGIVSTSFAIAKDILAHEFTHGVIEYTAGFKSSKGSNLTSNETGALNEAYSDILGVLIENEDWIMANKISETLNRNFINPNINSYPSEKGGEHYYPDSYLNGKTIDEFLNERGYSSIYDYDTGGVHHNSTVVSHAAYLMYLNGAFDSKEQMAKVWYNSLFLLTETSNFEDCALAVIQIAKNMGFSNKKITIIEEAFYETKILERKYGYLSGVVFDSQSNEKINNALVTVINKANELVYYEMYTDTNGEYKFEKLPFGEYTIVFEKSKYNDLEKELTLKEDTRDYNGELTVIDEDEFKESEIIFVMDVSLSMDTSDPNDVRKQIISNILSMLNSDAKVGLVTFTLKGNIINNGLISKKVDKKILMTDIFNMVNDDGTKSFSGTNGKAGLDMALSMFTSNSKTRKYIVFLTDGVDNGMDYETPTYNDLITKANELKVRIISIGLGTDEQIDEENLISIAKNTRGKYYHAINASKLYSFDLRIFEELE